MYFPMTQTDFINFYYITIDYSKINKYEIIAPSLPDCR